MTGSRVGDERAGAGPSFALPVLAVYGCFLMEWLFQATKPSFITRLGTPDALSTLATPPLVLVLLLVLPFLLLRLAGRRPAAGYALLVTGLALAATLVLAIDNFTATVFGFGALNLRFPLKYVYAALYLLFLLRLLVSRGLRGLCRPGGGARRWLNRLAGGLVLVSVALLAFKLADGRDATLPAGALASGGTGGARPNVVILSSDGVESDHMSVYGYGRKTTPFLDSRADELLIYENAFANASNTTGSNTSMLTGRLPTEAHLVYAPDVLLFENTVLSLPALLRQKGYTTADVSVRHYADPIDLNMLTAFDEANGHAGLTDRLPAAFLRSRLGLRLSPELFFVQNLADRLLSRLLHVFSLTDLANPYLQVQTVLHGEKARIDYMDRLIATLPEPFFINLYLLDTHGPVFAPEQRTFSAGERQDAEWKDDFFDDVILGFDAQIRDFYAALRRRGVLGRTLVIVTSDHGRGWEPLRRVPLLLDLPGRTPGRRIARDVQRLDLAPTIARLIGLAPPAWMSGHALLDGAEGAAPRPIYFTRARATGSARFVDQYVARYHAPYYALAGMGLIDCQRWYELDLDSGRLGQGEIPDHTAPCPAADLLSAAQARRLLRRHLARNRWRPDG